MPRILIVTPAPPGSLAGNRQTAARWSRMLEKLGHAVEVRERWGGERADLMIALHARKSLAAFRAFGEAHPGRPRVIVLTGTDLYRDIRSSPDAAAALDEADALVVLQEKALDELSPARRARARVIHQSAHADLPRSPPADRFSACVLGHLRPEKDPLRAALALRHLPPELPLEIVQAGQALDERCAREARAVMAREPRYRWIGEVSHADAMRLLAGSHAMIISSLLEGGAHVVSEAIAQGVAVLASDIPGNRGLLGDGYAGYFEVGSETALAGLLARAAREPAFLAALAAAVAARGPLVAPALEIERLRALVAGLL